MGPNDFFHFRAPTLPPHDRLQWWSRDRLSRTLERDIGEAMDLDMECQSTEPWPRAGQTVEVTPYAGTGMGYVTTILHISESGHMVCELPGLLSPISLATPVHSQVVVTLLRDGVPQVRWLGTVVAFGSWGLGLRINRSVDDTDSSGPAILAFPGQERQDPVVLGA